MGGVSRKTISVLIGLAIAMRSGQPVPRPEPRRRHVQVDGPPPSGVAASVDRPCSRFVSSVGSSATSATFRSSPPRSCGRAALGSAFASTDECRRHTHEGTNSDRVDASASLATERALRLWSVIPALLLHAAMRRPRCRAALFSSQPSPGKQVSIWSRSSRPGAGTRVEAKPGTLALRVRERVDARFHVKPGLPGFPRSS